jgi:hypothetical protein
MTTTDGSPCEGEHDLWKEIANMKEHIRKLEGLNNKEGYGNIEREEEVNEFFFIFLLYVFLLIF